jgi:putative transposase
LRSKQNTRRLERLTRTGKARILNAALSERHGRLFVSFGTIVQQQRPAPAKPQATAGVDLGMRNLATIVDTNGDITEVPNPAPLRATLTERRRTGRQMSRRIVGSRGWREAKAKLSRLDRKTGNIRKQEWHTLTTTLARTYGRVVVEDLNVAAMKKSMGRRAFRRAVSDTALGMFRPMLTYKTGWHGTELVVADRWYPSSKVHHGCGCRLVEPKKLAKQLVCSVTGEHVDRDMNAAKNLRDYPETITGVVDARAPQASATRRGGGQAHRTTGGRGTDRKTTAHAAASPDEAETRKGTPRRGAA